MGAEGANVVGKLVGNPLGALKIGLFGLPPALPAFFTVVGKDVSRLVGNPELSGDPLEGLWGLEPAFPANLTDVGADVGYPE